MPHADFVHLRVHSAYSLSEGAIKVDQLPALAPEPIVLLTQDPTGLANLQRLSSAGFLDTDPGQKPQLPFDRVAQHAAWRATLADATTRSLPANQPNLQNADSCCE